jgi:arginase
MTDFRLLAVPYEVGAVRMGVGRGPEHLLEAGAEKALGSRGGRVTTEVIELREHRRDASGASEAGAGFELIRLVAARAREAISEGAFPVLLSGSCFAGLGMVAAMDESAPGVVWFDAHGDFNTPESSVDGYFDGMGLAILTGGAWRSMAAPSMGGRNVAESAVVLAAARDFDELEQERLAGSSIVQLAADEIDSGDALARAAESLEPRPTGLYVHIDLDVLDSEEAAVNIYSVPGGLDAEQLIAQVRSLLDTQLVRALSLTAYDPECDTADRVPPIALGLLEIVAEQVSRDASRDRRP